VFSKTNIKPEILVGVPLGFMWIICEDVNLQELQLTYLDRKNMDNIR